MNSPEPLTDINAKLDELEATVARLTPKPKPLPDDAHRVDRQDVLDLLHAVHDTAPGIWLPISQLASHRHERLRYRTIQEHLAWLVEHHHVQRLTVATPHGPGRMALVRLRTDIDTVLTAPVELRINTELAAVGHRIAIHPARPTLSHFHVREITTGHGTFTCYRRWHHWEPRVERIEPAGH